MFDLVFGIGLGIVFLVGFWKSRNNTADCRVTLQLTEVSFQPENSVTWAQALELVASIYQVQKDQAKALEKFQVSLDELKESWNCSPPSPEPEVSEFYTNDNVCELASPEYVMEGHAPWENQETIEMVETVVEEEVVGDNATSDSTAFDDFDIFENVDNVDLVMCECVPSPENLVDEDVVEGAVSDSTDPSPTIPEIVEVSDTIGEGGVDDNITPDPEIFKNVEKFESKDLMMGDFVPPPDQTSRSLLVPIHLLDDDQEDDADELVFENNKHGFIATHDPFMNGKLDVINTIDEDIWKHPDMLPSDPIRLENLYWYCKPKLQTEDSTRDASKMKSAKQLLGEALGALHVKPVMLKRHRRKDRAWRFKATSKHSREIIRKRKPDSSRGTGKPFDPGKSEYGISEGMVATEIQWSQMAICQIVTVASTEGVAQCKCGVTVPLHLHHAGVFTAAPRLPNFIMNDANDRPCYSMIPTIKQFADNATRAARKRQCRDAETLFSHHYKYRSPVRLFTHPGTRRRDPKAQFRQFFSGNQYYG
ncbi:hypothetical protein L1887_28219 [Cichorium endivia]|nr:hypothetical protein L1887_28219 [Cichorium endivia]